MTTGVGGGGGGGGGGGAFLLKALALFDSCEQHFV